MHREHTPSEPTVNSRSAKKPIYRRLWAWAVLAVVLVGIVAACSAGGDDAAGATSAPPASTSAPASSAASPPPTTQAPAPSDDPLEDKLWTASDVQVKKTDFGTEISARVTNNGDKPRSGLFTLTIFDANGARIYNAQGSADSVQPGQTVTTTFIGTTDQLPGDPATYRYQFQADMTD